MTVGDHVQVRQVCKGIAQVKDRPSPAREHLDNLHRATVELRLMSPAAEDFDPITDCHRATIDIVPGLAFADHTAAPNHACYVVPTYRGC